MTDYSILSILILYTHAMTAINLRLHFLSLSTQVSDSLKTNKRLFLFANFGCSFPKIYCSRRRSSGRVTSPPVDLNIDKLEADVCSVNYKRWKSVAKRKVAMRVGYVGTNYKGLQIQRYSATTFTIERELERAILKAGGMLESNYGNLQKIGWRRSSRTDKGVHSLATVITLKMEVPDGAWVDDPDGTQLAEAINHYLPYDIRVFSILPINKGFDARIDCASRKYTYLLPAGAIGIENNCSPEEIEQNVREFRDILQIFKGNHPFHNYTIRAQYRKRSSKKNGYVSRQNNSVKEGSSQETDDCSRNHKNSTNDGNNTEKEISNLSDSFDAEEDHMNSIQDIECEPNIASTPGESKLPHAKWLHERDEADLISAAHFRKVLSCNCGDLKAIANAQYIEISFHGESFVFHQVASSSSSERNRSTYSFIHSVKCNRLAASKAEELVYVHSNLRLLTHSQNEYNEGGIKFWDVYPERTDLDFSAGAQSLLNVQSGSHHPPSASSSVAACDSNLLASSNVIVTDDVDVDVDDLI